jgi:protein-disulfide isomerase
MKSALLLLIAKAGRVFGAVVFAAVSFSALASSPASATSNSALSCVARVLDSRFNYNVVIINVATRPRADVSGTETAATHSWSMAATAPANASGIARLAQKVSVVSKFEVVKVTVRVTLNGLSGHCVTEYTPPTLTARI